MSYRIICDNLHSDFYMDQADKKEYEVAFLIKESDSPLPVREAVNRLGGEVTFEGETRPIAFAYPIEKELGGIFSFFHFLLDPEKLSEFSKIMRMEKTALRFLVVKEPIKREPKSDEDSIRKSSRQIYRAVPKEPKKSVVGEVTNEDLERKLEEILK